MIEQAAAVCNGASGHPGLSLARRPEALISSAGIWDNRFGAFLYSNAAWSPASARPARLAELLDRAEPAARWRALADRIWEEGILRQAALEAEGRGWSIPRRAVSSTRDGSRPSARLWTDRPEFLIEHSRDLDISLLGPVIPFGLLPASDPRMIRTAEAILRHSIIDGDPNTLARWSPDPTRPSRRVAPSESHSHDISSLATLWMARYLIQLGRETGQGRHWNRGVAMLDSILLRLLPLGLGLRAAVRLSDPQRFNLHAAAGVWGLHAMLIETMLDLAGLDYDALERRLTLSPALPSAWPHIGLSQTFACGEVSYRLDRPIGGTVYQLGLKARLDYPVTLRAVADLPRPHRARPLELLPRNSAPRVRAPD